jgi:SOS response regulatory protein OraA/RecX
MNSEKILVEKLEKWNYSAEAIEYTIHELKRYKYLDDARLITALSEEFFDFKKYGPVRVKQALYKRKFDTRLIDQTLMEFEDQDRDKDNALYWGLKKMKALAGKERPKQVRSLQQHLYTKGFKTDTIRYVTQKLIFDRQDDDE